MRERAETPEAAQQRYVRFLQPALSCISAAQWDIAHLSDGADLALLTSEHPIRLDRKRGLAKLSFSAYQRFEPVEDERREGKWRIRTLSYAYEVFVESRRSPEREKVFAWHWHPDRTPQRPQPHVHIEVEHRLLGLKLANLHVPTGRVSFEEVVRFLIDELRVTAREDDWRTILDDTERRFREYRTWA